MGSFFWWKKYEKQENHYFLRDTIEILKRMSQESHQRLWLKCCVLRRPSHLSAVCDDGPAVAAVQTWLPLTGPCADFYYLITAAPVTLTANSRGERATLSLRQPACSLTSWQRDLHGNCTWHWVWLCVCFVQVEFFNIVSFRAIKTDQINPQE